MQVLDRISNELQTVRKPYLSVKYMKPTKIPDFAFRYAQQYVLYTYGLGLVAVACKEMRVYRFNWIPKSYGMFNGYDQLPGLHAYYSGNSDLIQMFPRKENFSVKFLKKRHIPGQQTSNAPRSPQVARGISQFFKLMGLLARIRKLESTKTLRTPARGAREYVFADYSCSLFSQSYSQLIKRAQAFLSKFSDPSFCGSYGGGCSCDGSGLSYTPLFPVFSLATNTVRVCLPDPAQVSVSESESESESDESGDESGYESGLSYSEFGMDFESKHSDRYDQAICKPGCDCMDCCMSSLPEPDESEFMD